MDLVSTEQIFIRERIMRNEKGVTLIEVVSCMVILSVLAGMAIPTVENMKARLALHGEVSKLVGELHKARFFAIKSNTKVVFQYTENGYMIFIDDGSNGGNKEDWMHQSGEQVLADVTLGERLKIATLESSFPSQRTRFSGKPGITGGAVVLQGSNGNKSKVIVNSIGRVRVEKL
jgi:prepilin-type N-terminal cleavage/methylation domain-containing protein